MNTGMSFHGLPTFSISNQFLHVEFLAETGPRIVRLSLAGRDDNLLAETPDVTWETTYGTFHIRGGHRLWHAPEAMPRTYMPDNEGLEVEPFEGGVRLRQPVEAPTGIQKVMELTLHPDRPALTVQHALYNAGAWTVDLAPWAITQVPLGGVAVLPMQAPVPSQHLPTHQVNLWSYTRIRDTRLRLDDDLTLVEGKKRKQPFKIGYFNHAGWLGYLAGDVFFVNRFEPQPDRLHADQNSNCEVYVWDRFLELETLAPLAHLEPGATTTHVETWELFAGVRAQPTIDGIRQLVQELGLP